MSAKLTPKNKAKLLDLDNELWKDIKGYENLYCVSNMGRVKSLERFVNHKYGNRIVRSKILIPAFNTNKKYLFVCLSKNSKTKPHLLHRLVAIAHIPNPENKPEVNHIKNEFGVINRLDNRACVLEWNTGEENRNNAVKDGLIQNGEKHSMAKLTEKDVLEIRARKLSVNELSLMFRVTQSNIYRIINRISWKHI